MQMIPSPNGPMFQFDNQEELTYHFLNCMGLSVRPNGVIIDTELNSAGGAGITFGGKTLKANIKPNDIHYAGEGELVIDILNGYKIVNTLLGLFLDKKKNFDGLETVSYFSNDGMDAEGNKMSSTSVKFINGEIYTSEMYYNKCLSLIDVIFQIGEENVFLKNFDCLQVEQQ